jgi:hypothetical protein
VQLSLIFSSGWEKTGFMANDKSRKTEKENNLLLFIFIFRVLGFINKNGIIFSV